MNRRPNGVNWSTPRRPARQPGGTATAALPPYRWPEDHVHDRIVRATAVAERYRQHRQLRRTARWRRQLQRAGEQLRRAGVE